MGSVTHWFCKTQIHPRLFGTGREESRGWPSSMWGLQTFLTGLCSSNLNKGTRELEL